MSEEIKVGDRVRYEDAHFPAVVLWVDELDVLIELQKSKGRQLWPRHKTVLYPQTVIFEVTLPLEEANILDSFWTCHSAMSTSAVKKIHKILKEALKKAGPQ